MPWKPFWGLSSNWCAVLLKSPWCRDWQVFKEEQKRVENRPEKIFISSLFSCKLITRHSAAVNQWYIPRRGFISHVPVDRLLVTLSQEAHMSDKLITKPFCSDFINSLFILHWIACKFCLKSVSHRPDRLLHNCHRLFVWCLKEQHQLRRIKAVRPKSASRQLLFQFLC